jgi:uncharacterized SAM-binding protein YcdF (DUF218 family)
MTHERLARMRRLLGRATAALTTLGLVATVLFLPFAGRYLVAEDPLTTADSIFVLAGARAERWLEAVDLYREKWAPRILLSSGRHEAAEIALRSRGIRFPSSEELARDAIGQLGVPDAAVTIVETEVDNTAQEAEELRRKATAAGWHRVIVVTSKYHTRRAGFAFARAFRGSGVVIVMRGSRYDTATPARWWADRADVRFVGSELVKLLLYRLGLAG